LKTESGRLQKVSYFSGAHDLSAPVNPARARELARDAGDSIPYEFRYSAASYLRRGGRALTRRGECLAAPRRRQRDFERMTGVAA
jgi:hypothetical protein